MIGDLIVFDARYSYVPENCIILSPFTGDLKVKQPFANCMIDDVIDLGYTPVLLKGTRIEGFYEVPEIKAIITSNL